MNHLEDDDRPSVHVTRSLLEVLLEAASEAEPEGVTYGLAITAAGAFDDLDLPQGTPVFTHLYLPDAGRSVSAVFGVDLGTPPGRTPGLFVSHPDGNPDVARTDDLREVVLVAVPPWDDESVAAYGRDGRRRRLHRVDAEPPSETLP